MEYSMVICDGADETLEEILDFANMVFGMSYGCIDFAALYPKAYSNGRAGLVTHHIIRENGKIRALVDSYPVSLRLGGERGRKLKASYIGTVAVHPNSRGKGYMTELMRLAEQDARAQGCALMMVDGARHRYRPFGYERAGIKYCFFVGADNIRHCCTDGAKSYRFEAVDEECPYLDNMYELYCQRNVTARGRDDFLPCLLGEKALVYAVLDDAGFVGYVSMSADEGKLLEFELEDISELPQMLCELMDELGCDEVMAVVGADERAKAKALENVCDYCHMAMSHQIKILDYAAALKFFLEWKQKYETLAQGEYVVEIGNEKEGNAGRFLISVGGEGIDVSATDRGADAVFDGLEFVCTMTTSMFYLGHKADKAPAGWFPLPFYLPAADEF